MKINYLFFFILLFSTTIIFSQTGIITYKVKKLNNPKTSKPEMSKRITEEVNRATFSLIYNKKKSFFKIIKIIPIHPFEFKVARILTNSKFDWHQFNNSDKFSTYVRKIKKKSYWVDHSTKMMDWKLTSDMKVIDGYTCYKAIRKVFNSRSGKTTERIAWFTPDIPVPYGPVGNGGLPGLILQLTIADKLNYIVDKIILNPNKTIKIPTLKEGKRVSIKEIVRISRDTRKVTKD